MEEITRKLSELVKSRKDEKIIYKMCKSNRVSVYKEHSEYEQNLM